MTPRLQHLFDTLEKDRLALMKDLRALPPEIFHRSVAGKWSIAQITAHLVASERLMLQYMRKKILAVASLKDSGVREELKMLLLKISQRLPFRFRAPTLVVRSTAEYASATQAAEDWETERNDLRTFLESISENQLKKMFYRHPVAGYMNIQHALKFFREHYHHHIPQIKRLL